MKRTLQDLQGMTETDLTEAFDQEFRGAYTADGLMTLYYGEIARRAQERQSSVMLEYTKALKVYTLWIVVLTVWMALSTIVSTYVMFKQWPSPGR